ncbi:autophagy-related 18a [Anaeramoeba flamelloides]|uniref:Autophagy-related 18a n=1 Tax=Anaeramoeba flamelloides TaxID=1746091 RepID=A0ABQ8XFG4_9EUKA|nr:autophagy-related 18a [Anaeramoeba flamelloides]
MVVFFTIKKSINPFSKRSENLETSLEIGAMLFSSSLFVYTSNEKEITKELNTENEEFQLQNQSQSQTQDHYKLLIKNLLSNQLIHQLEFPTKILGTKQNQKRLVVALESQIHIYDLTNLERLGICKIKSGFGVLALSSGNNCYLAYPPSSDSGRVTLFDALNMRMIHSIKCHNSRITKIEFSRDEKLFATVSKKGTIIRIFQVKNPKNTLCELRRGSKARKIYHIAFSSNSEFLSVTSESGTIHIFKIKEKGSFLSVANRSFIEIKYRKSTPHLAYYDLDRGGVVVATSEGKLFFCEIDPNNIKKQYKFTNQESLMI